MAKKKAKYRNHFDSTFTGMGFEQCVNMYELSNKYKDMLMGWESRTKHGDLLPKEGLYIEPMDLHKIRTLIDECNFMLEEILNGNTTKIRTID